MADNISRVNAQRTQSERRKAASKAGKASGQARANYASWKQCFRERCTPEQMKQMYDKLWTLFYKSNNLNALEMLLKGLDDDSTKNDAHVTVTFRSEDMDEYGD